MSTPYVPGQDTPQTHEYRADLLQFTPGSERLARLQEAMEERASHGWTAHTCSVSGTSNGDVLFMLWERPYRPADPAPEAGQ
jgi:hypothetical protein